MLDNNIMNTTEEEAQLMINDYVNGVIVYDQSGLGNGKIISIENEVCVIKFENSTVMYSNKLFQKDFVDKIKKQMNLKI